MLHVLTHSFPTRRSSDLVKKVCEHDADHGHFPDYAVTMDDDVILFRNHSGLKSKPDPVASAGDDAPYIDPETMRSEEHTSELQSLMRNSYAVFCLKKKT